MAHTPHPQLDLDAQLCFPLYAATRAVTRAYGTLLAETGLTYPQYLALLALWGADGPMTVGELGARLRLDSGTLTPLLKRLESAGQVTRSRDAADERRVRVEVTDAGWQLRDRVAGVPFELFSTLGLEQGDAAELRRLLARVVERLDAGMIG
ncbi:MAG: MarR family winged helix-turn-helix transcriptional regulator [Nocardioides sp.]